MRIESLSNLPLGPVGNSAAQRSAADFGKAVKATLSEVNRLQFEADKMATELAAGDDVEIHQAMIAMQKASTALQFTVQVRNKIIEAYQEIMRMQV